MIITKITAYAVGAWLFFPATFVFALPQGAVLEQGQATLNFQPTSLTVTQQTDKAILNYDSFSIAPTESVTFQQPSAASIALNRVTGGNPSQILGSLTANGKIFLINPNGIVFGNGSRVDTAGLVASTLSISSSDFMSDQYRFTGANGSVVNSGLLNAPGGYVALLGALVENNGSIEAHLGSVALASGDAIILSFDAQGLINFVIDDPASTTPHAARAAVSNRGQLRAQGGRVVLNAKTLNTVFDEAINTEGLIEATSLFTRDGEILLTANNDIKVGGTLSGGSVQITSTAGNVTHLTGSQVSTFGKDFVGFSGGNYIFDNGAQVSVGPGDISITAGSNIILDPQGNVSSYLRYDWNYVGAQRSFHLKEFGYYFLNSQNQVVYVPLSIGENIGLDGVTPTFGSGFIYEDSPLTLYTVFFRPGDAYVFPSDTSGLTSWTFHSEAARNVDGQDHVRVNGNRFSWEDVFGLGDKDFNDATFDFVTQRITPEVQPHFISQNAPDLTAPNILPVVPPAPAPAPIFSPGPSSTTNLSGSLISLSAQSDNLSVYYEILDPSRLIHFEPVNNIGLFAYHPLTPTDASAFEQIDLDIRAFEFINENIERKEKQAPFFGI